MRRANRNGSTLRRRVLAWHRRVGIIVSALVLVVVVTGLPLNHADTLGLDRNVVANETLLGWYGLEPQGEPVGYRIGANWLIWLQGSLYLNDRRLSEAAGRVRGAVGVNDLVVVAAPRELFVFTDDGSLVEKLSGAGVPGPIEAIGLADDNRIILRTAAGRFAAGSDFVDWTPSAAPVDWARPVPLPPKLRSEVLKSYRGGGLPWSRLLLDIHTGRIFGAWGPYLIDGVALALLVLIGSGIYNWLRRER